MSSQAPVILSFTGSSGLRIFAAAENGKYKCQCKDERNHMAFLHVFNFLSLTHTDKKLSVCLKDCVKLRFFLVYLIKKFGNIFTGAAAENIGNFTYWDINRGDSEVCGNALN